MEWAVENWPTIKLVLQIVGIVLGTLTSVGGVKLALVFRAIVKVLTRRIEDAAADSPQAKRALRKRRIGDGLKRAGNALLANAAADVDSNPEHKLSKKERGLNVLRALLRR